MLSVAPCSLRYMLQVPPHAVTNVCPWRPGKAPEWVTLEEDKLAWQRGGGRGFRQRHSLSKSRAAGKIGAGVQRGGCRGHGTSLWGLWVRNYGSCLGG